VIGRALEVLRAEDEWLVENKTAIGEKIPRAPEQSREDRRWRHAFDKTKVTISYPRDFVKQQMAYRAMYSTKPGK
jgi:hypothetical protein